MVYVWEGVNNHPLPPFSLNLHLDLWHSVWNFWKFQALKSTVISLPDQTERLMVDQRDCNQAQNSVLSCTGHTGIDLELIYWSWSDTNAPQFVWTSHPHFPQRRGTSPIFQYEGSLSLSILGHSAELSHFLSSYAHCTHTHLEIHIGDEIMVKITIVRK